MSTRGSNFHIFRKSCNFPILRHNMCYSLIEFFVTTLRAILTMPKRKYQEPTPKVMSRWWSKGTDWSDNATLASQPPPLPSTWKRTNKHGAPDPINATFQRAIALLQVSQAVADIISRQTRRTPTEPLLPSKPMDETSIGTLWHISNIYLA